MKKGNRPFTKYRIVVTREILRNDESSYLETEDMFAFFTQDKVISKTVYKGMKELAKAGESDGPLSFLVDEE